MHRHRPAWRLLFRSPGIASRTARVACRPTQYRPFGRHGFTCAEIGFGTWAIGGLWGTQADTDSLAALHRALNLGCNFIDTAPAISWATASPALSPSARTRSSPTSPTPVTPLPQAALKWVLAHPAVSTIIPGIRSIAQAQANWRRERPAGDAAALVQKLRHHHWRRGIWYGAKSP